MSVYFYHLPKSNLVKIGVSSNVNQRMKTLNTGCSEQGNLIRVIDDCGFAAEKWLHNYFNAYKVKGEWFSFVEDMLDVQIPVTLKNPTLPPFSMVGNGEKNRMYQAYPLINTLLDLSKPEAWFMKMVFKHLNNSTNTSRIPYDTLSETEKRVANKAYTLLKQKELVRKVKLHTYMINPTALITNNFAEHIEAWKALDKPKKSKTVEYSKVYVYPKHFWVLGYKSWNINKLAYIV
jgi:hypothetical protein